MPTRIRLRRNPAATWVADNPLLALGEPGLETDTGLEKVGDGVTNWVSLPYKRTPATAGISRIDFSGHSFPASVGASNGDSNGFCDRLTRALGGPKRANIAKSGSITCWPTAGASGDGGWSWVLRMFAPAFAGDDLGVYLPRTTLAVMMNGNNDYVTLGVANSKPFTEALKTVISRYCTSALYEETDPSWAFTGGSWSTATSNIYSGGTARTTTTLNQTATWTAPADYPGNLICAIGLAVTPGTPGAGNTLVLGCTIDGVTKPDITINLDTGGHADAAHGKTNGIVLRFGRSDCGQNIALASGTHTIALTNKGGTAGAAFTVDYAQIEADPLDGPVVTVLSEIQAAGAPDPGIPTWNIATKAALPDFPGRTVWVDVDGALNQNAALFSTSASGHPNNAGYAVIAKAVYDALLNSALLTDRVLARTSMRGLGRYDGGFWTPIAGDYGVSVGPGYSNGWTNAGVDFGYPAFRKDMQERVFLRGAVNQPSTGVAATTVISPIGTNTGYQSTIRYKQHVVVVWTGSANQPGYLTVLSDNGLQLSAGGSNATGNINGIEHDYMADYST